MIIDHIVRSVWDKSPLTLDLRLELAEDETIATVVASSRDAATDEATTAAFLEGPAALAQGGLVTIAFTPLVAPPPTLPTQIVTYLVTTSLGNEYTPELEIALTAAAPR